jgi:hypothetical protein
VARDGPSLLIPFIGNRLQPDGTESVVKIRVQNEQGKKSLAGGARWRRQRIGSENDMEDDLIVVLVGLVEMRHPLLSILMQLYITIECDIANADSRTGEIRPSVTVWRSRKKDFHLSAIRGVQNTRIKPLVLPHVVQKTLGDVLGIHE